jgi:hypothetical protein
MSRRVRPPPGAIAGDGDCRQHRDKKGIGASLIAARASDVLISIIDMPSTFL